MGMVPQDPMAGGGPPKGGARQGVMGTPGGPQMLGNTLGAAVNAPGGGKIQPQAPGPNGGPSPGPGAGVIMPDGQGPVTSMVPEERPMLPAIVPSPQTPQLLQQQQVGMYPPQPPMAKPAAWLRIALGQLKNAAQLPGPNVPMRAPLAPALGGGARAMPLSAPVKQPVQNRQAVQSPILRADVGTKTMQAPRTTKVAKTIANNQDSGLPSRLDIGRQIRVVNGRMEGDGIDALYEDPELSRRMRGFKKNSTALFPLHRPVIIKQSAWPNMMGNTQSTDASMGSSAGAMSLGKPGALQGATENPNIDFAPSGIKGKPGSNKALGGGGQSGGLSSGGGGSAPAGGSAPRSTSIGDMRTRFQNMQPALPRANSGASAATDLLSPAQDMSPVRRGTPQQPQTQTSAFQSGAAPQFQTSAPGPLSGMLKRFSAQVGEAFSKQAI